MSDNIEEIVGATIWGLCRPLYCSIYGRDDRISSRNHAAAVDSPAEEDDRFADVKNKWVKI